MSDYDYSEESLRNEAEAIIAHHEKRRRDQLARYHLLELIEGLPESVLEHYRPEEPITEAGALEQVKACMDLSIRISTADMRHMWCGEQDGAIEKANANHWYSFVWLYVYELVQRRDLEIMKGL